MKKNILFTLLFFLSLGCEEDSDQDQELNQDCQNSSLISFNFQGSSFWDSDLGEYISLDDINIIVCDTDFVVGASCNNVFMDDVDINPDGTIDIKASIQYQCHPDAPGMFNGGYVSTLDFGFKNIASFQNNIGEELNISTVDPGTWSNGPQFMLGENCIYQTSSGNFVFSEINLKTNTFKGSFSFSLSPHSLIPEQCNPGLDNLLVSGDFEFLNFN